MPRGPRLDAPGVLHHVMARGIMRQLLFRDDTDREDFVSRVATLAEGQRWRVYAWALLPNHFHLLVRTGQQPLSRSMRSLLTGYAGTFNRRHRRSGHVFQNRYKSIVCEEEAYFLELVRYLHLNPVRAGVVQDLKELAAYPYSGHAALVGQQTRPWQETETVLGHFSATLRVARRQYATFVAEGAAQGRRPELQGGGLVRSAGGWVAVQELRQGRESYRGDERILGSSAFVEEMEREVAEREGQQGELRARQLPLAEVIERVCQATQVEPQAARGGGRRAAVSRVREGVAYLWVRYLGHSGSAVAQALGIRPESVYKAAQRGEQDAERWQALVAVE